jgi:hypothetical protein
MVNIGPTPPSTTSEPPTHKKANKNTPPSATFLLLRILNFLNTVRGNTKIKKSVAILIPEWLQYTANVWQ